MSSGEIIDILSRNKSLLRKYHVLKIGLFGSYARGDQIYGSDIDLLVEFDESAFGTDYDGYFDTVSSLSDELSSILDHTVDLVTIDMLSPHIAPGVMKEVRFIERL